MSEDVQNEFNLEGYIENTQLTEKEKSSLISYPFTAISEIYQATKTYGEKALETAKNIVSYPYEAFSQTLTSEKPTGIIKGEDFNFKMFLTMPYILIPLSILGFWIYSVFKKR